MKFGTILVDPPWNYNRTSSSTKLSGYSDSKYLPLTTPELSKMPVGDLGTDESVVLLWTTYPFIHDAQALIEDWGYEFVTGLAWVKTMDDMTKVSYGVGYWFRGAVEHLLVGKRKKSYRTNWTGLISPRLEHSRKPTSVYELCESFPGPRLELFGRGDVSRGDTDWYVLGDEAPGDGLDIRLRLPELLVSEDWEPHRATTME